jgi:signal transduction histidine kinase
LDSDRRSLANSKKQKLVQYPLLFVVVAIGIILSIFSYNYFLSISSKIDETIRDDIRRQARIDAFYVTEILEKEIQVVDTNVMIGSHISALINGELGRGAEIINARQQSTHELTDRYFWLDQSGKTVWSSAFANNPEEYEELKGFDVSDRPYFENPANTKVPYLSPVVLGLDGSQRMFIAYPILGTDDEFKGVFAASIRADVLGDLVQSKLSPETENSIGIIDPNGIIIYSSSSEFIGENLFGEKVQSVLRSAFTSQEQIEEFNNFLQASIGGGTDSKDFSAVNGATSTVTYLPIRVTGSSDVDTGNADDQGHHFLTLYLTAPHNVAAVIEPLVAEQRNYSIAVIGTIAAVTAVVLYVILTWNWRLERTVRERTASLNQANEQLQIHDKMQTEFINIAAHELRTPVQPLLNISEQLEQDLAEGLGEIKVSRPEIEMLARNAKRLAQLTGDVLEVARIESNSLSLRKQEIDLKVKIQNVIEDCKAFIEDGQSVNIVFEDLTGKAQIMVNADKSRLFEVLSNLIRNAIKFTEEGVITVKLEQKNEHVEVSVKDPGKGIDSDIFPNLFEKFTTKSEKGTGLGLYIAKSFVEAHGGKIWGQNNPEGKGATFTFTLPMAKKEKAESTTT